MTQKGTHTWDLIVQYHRCPKCGYIQESRENYEYRLGKYEKDLECERCHHRYHLEKKVKAKFAPLVGEPEYVEWDWNAK